MFMDIRKEQKGFAVAPLIIAIVILIVGSIGIYVWKKDDGKTKHSGDTMQATQPTSSETPEQNTQENKYLVVSEWGVRITLPDELVGDIYYFMNDRAERLSGGPVLVDFTSKKFTAGNLKCAVIEDGKRSLVSLERIELGNNNPSDYTPAPFKTIGNNAYRFAGTGCEEAINREGTAQDKQLLESLKNAVANTLEPSSN
jgi:hypothetical protein